MSIISTKDLDIYFEKSAPRKNGSILYIGGTAGDLRNKPNQLDFPLTEQFQIISYDQRGLGQTEKPSGSYTMQQYADDASNLLDELGIEQIPVMGVSFGGMVALELVKRHPSKVSRLVLACTSSGGAGGSSYPLHELELLDPEKKLEASIKINDLRVTDEWIKENREIWDSMKQQALSRNPFKPDSNNLLKQLMARKEHDVYESLEKINMPVLLMGGKYDGIAPISNMKALNEKIKNSVLKLYEGGHLFLIQDKNAFKDLENWLIN